MQRANKLNLFDFTMIVVSLVIGMGIFRTPVSVAEAAPNSFVFFAAWIAGGLVALCGALTYAEIGSRMPVTGAYYKVFSYSYHPSIAFGVNCIILISNAASTAAVAMIGAEYISNVIFPGVKDTQSYQVIIAIISIAIFYGVNLAGLKMSARTQSVLTMIKIAMILLLIVPLFFVKDGGAAVTVTNAVNPTMLEYLKAFGVGLVAVSFTYGGYQQTINFGAEVSRPERNIPRGIFTGLFIIILLYLTINYAYVKVIGYENLRHAEGIAAKMAAFVFGDAAGKVLSVLLFLSVLAYVNVLLLSNPRVMYAMSEDGVLPRIFGKRTTDKDVLIVSLSAFAGASMLIVFWSKEFDRVMSFSIFLDCIGMALSAGSIFILRKRGIQPEGASIFSMRLYPLLPVIFILAYIFVAISITVYKPQIALAGSSVLAAFIVIYFVTRRGKRNEPVSDLL